MTETFHRVDDRSTSRLLGVALALLAMAPLTGHASAWLEPFGAVRLGAGYTFNTNEKQFAPGDAPGFTGPLCPDPIGPGDRMPYSCVTGGRYASHGLHLQASAGITPNLTLDVTVPIVLSARFVDDIGETKVSGIGDLRFGLRTGGERTGWAFAAEVLVGAPTAPAGLEDRDIPLGEGQWDVEIGGRIGRSLWPWGWIEMHQALRLRIKSPKATIDRGEEWFGSVSGGFTPFAHLALTGGIEWILAAPDKDAFDLPSPGRKLVQVRPGLLGLITPDLTVGVSAGIPLVGEKWPTGVAVSASLSGRIRECLAPSLRPLLGDLQDHRREPGGDR